MSDNLTLVLFLVGFALFAIGDVLWLVRNTFSRPMDVRVTGGLVVTGIVLMTVGLARWAVAAGGGA